MKARYLYFIKRGPKPDYHRAPFHPFIICSRKGVAEWQAGSTSDRAWVWEKDVNPHTGWLSVRWKGLDIDYGHVVHRIELPDGSTAGFKHYKNLWPWSLLKKAVWWSEDEMPEWLAELGVKRLDDEFSLGTIESDHKNYGRSR